MSVAPDAHPGPDDSRRKMLDSDIVGTLVALLGDHDWPVRRSAVNALAELAHYGKC
jgi:hypothetical protein